MLGILKAGAVFLPLDNGLPYERLKYILQDSKAKVLITPEMLLTEWETGTADPGVSLTPDDPAYLIYTSGSTGKPKGVLVPHRGLLNYSCWFSTTYGVGEKDSAVLFSSIAFDLGFTNLWPLLLSGGAVYLQEESALLDTAALSRLLLDKHISVLKLTPSHFSLLLQTPGFIDSIPELALRLIVLGGEESRLQDIETYFRLQPAITFVNHYGPTETTIGTASKRIDRDSWKSFARRPVIGKPVAGNEILILDAQNRVLPFGLTGEIAVGGEGLAIGYLGNETLTQEKFIPHPLRPGKRLYKTGDLGRLTLKGDIQFLGRRDFQVKMRGYRIELEEIRLVLADYPGIGEAAVLYLQEGPGSGNLAAYFTVTAGFDKAGLSDHLSRHLPAYMLPSYFIPVDILPLTPNGKIDRNALLALPLEKNTSTGYIAPEKDIEKQIAGIWKDLLEVERVGVEDNFFDLGGNSLKLIIMLRSLSALFPGKVTLTDLFRYNTISSIIRHLGEEEEKEELVSYEI
jgi:amino acid adenylation domain-containing protein